jgi:hypothetical protein
VRVTHPFHPWCGREFEFVALRNNWGEDRVCFHDERGELKSLPTAWTDAAEPDPFVIMAAGRCAFRIDDLLALAAMISRPHSA